MSAPDGFDHVSPIVRVMAYRDAGLTFEMAYRRERTRYGLDKATLRLVWEADRGRRPDAARR